MRTAAAVGGLAMLLSGCVTKAGRTDATPGEAIPGEASFASFDSRAVAGQTLNVVFFGASLTWGANSSDPANTSYRAYLCSRLEKEYPRARFRCYDAAIGGTGSGLGVFRVERDVLRRNPDIVFVDFTANDDIYSADAAKDSSYEAIIRRIITEAGCPVVSVVFPFKWNVEKADLEKMKRRDAHYRIAAAYGVPVGDAVTGVIDAVKAGRHTIAEVWPFDGAHPCDIGYRLFAEAAWAGYRTGVEKRMVCAAPDSPVSDPLYMSAARVKLSSLDALPAGWRVGTTTRTAAWHDWRMSRWLDNVAIAKKGAAPLEVRVSGSSILLFGESTMKSGALRIRIDGREPIVKNVSAKKFGGNGRLVEKVADGLDPAVAHTVVIEPVFEGEAKEVRIESICVAGGEARVWLPGAQDAAAKEE